MNIFDISQELFTSRVFPGDKSPEFKRIADMNKDSNYNLTTMELCVHNGTHLDAPKHFIKNGKSIDKINLNRCIGECTVAELSGIITEKELSPILMHCKKRLLIKGDITITLEAAKAMNKAELLLFGTESFTVGPVTGPMPIHIELLDREVVLLEGLNLSSILPGEYFLSAAPLKLGGADGAPCRAVLIQFHSD